ncbi:MAG: RagB/SusD family nutrient uptake outer membrane protein, partial [Bacteroidales bacterium]
FERDKEFIWEGKRWFDVVRMKNGAGESMVFDAKANYDDPNPILTKDQAYMILWPIDINTLNNDPLLVNNPGYGN